MFFSGVAHLLPYSAVIRAKNCYDPYVFGPEDDIEEVDEGIEE